ncbi:MAG: protein kinase, partial [Gemmataceae bacterium]|nr:protein kinase [Gemmataceae bacterium]
GFGIVYRAFDDKLQRVVAVKVMAPHLAVTSPARKRFLREARSAAAVDHPNVVRVYAVEEQPLPFLVMEYIPGETLQGRLDRTGPVDAGECVRVGRQIAAGLAAAHEKGLIHRDIKPSNVLVDGGPAAAVKITDFGLARAADDASLTRSGAVAGTPMYMAPEQARGEALDHRADLFSLGSVLYQMASGRPPFRANSTLAVLKRVAEDDPRPIREIIPEVPDWYCRIVEKLHAKDPAERFQTAREVADLLADCETQLADGARLTNYSRIPQAKPATKPRPWSRRRVRVAGGLLALVSLVYIALWGGPFAQRYAANKGVVEIEPADGLMQVIVYGENGPVSDWYDARTSPQINLPPGQYTLVASVRPDKQIERWEINGRSFVWLGGMRITTPVANPTFAVKRGERVTISVTTRDAPPPAEGQSEKERLQGTWIAISLESQGKFLPVNPTGDLSLVIAGSQMRLTMRGNPAGGGAFTLDPSRTPKEIDVNEVDGKGRLLGIYRLEGDRLTLCLGDTGGPRPTMFETQPDLQSKRLNVVFRRATANEVGWVQLFNGKDLSGWKEFPAGRGSWTVENGLLVGKGRPSHLFTDRGDFTNFHLRMELRVRAGKNAGALGVFSRVPVEDPGVVLSTDEGMGFSKDRVLMIRMVGTMQLWIIAKTYG